MGTEHQPSGPLSDPWAFQEGSEQETKVKTYRGSVETPAANS